MPPMHNKGAFADSVFTYALTWSLGAISDYKAREVFTSALKFFAYELPLL